MKLHHIGIAVQSVRKEVPVYQKLLGTEKVSDIVYNHCQRAWLCLIGSDHDIRLELVEGEPVKNCLSKGIRIYHLCYETDNLEEEIKRMTQKGGILVSKPQKAVLFGGRRVAFVYTKAGLIELLEEDNGREGCR